MSKCVRTTSVGSLLSGCRGKTTLLLTLILLLGEPAAAQWSAGRLTKALEELPDGGERLLRTAQGLPSEVFLHPDDEHSLTVRRSVSWIVDVESFDRALEDGYVPITPTLAVAHLPVETWTSQSLVARAIPSSLRFPQMDLAHREVRAAQAVEEWGLKGDGTMIGVVDTGGDPTHPALQNADGTTKIAWLLAFDQYPRGVHAELEELYGCSSQDEPCAIYSREDIDALLSEDEQGPFPEDRIGHGTHLASLAAGRDPEYPGIAPRADIVIVAASTPEGGVTDSRILIGTKFVFDRADEANQPAVVNVSLGSSFGAHDGTSSLERGLAELADGPGRAIVVASGNSGDLLDFENANYPGPFGIHTEISVPSGSVVSVPLLHPSSDRETTFGSLFVWISAYEEDALSLGFRSSPDHGSVFVGPGESGGLTSSDWGDTDDYDVVLVNGADELDAEVQPGSMVFALAGSWKTGRTFEMLLRGRGTARIWASGPRGDFSTLLPRARRQGTVAIPGTGPELITVGATINRSAWVDWEGALVGASTHEVGLASFSAVGPNQRGDLKPELVAPGSGMIGAMASAADPRQPFGQVSQFASAGMCPDESECFVIDDHHGLAMGTSMSAPIVAGALALLFQRQPELTMENAKRLLMAGANSLPGPTEAGTMGLGQLDIVRTLLAQDAALRAAANGSSEDPTAVNAQKSYLVWADAFVHPSPGPALSGFLVLRDIDGNPVVVEPDDLEVSVLGPGRAEATVVQAGLVQLALLANGGSGTDQLVVTIRVREEIIETSAVPIALDPHLAAGLYEWGGGSCGWGRTPHTGERAVWWLLLASLVVLLRRRGAPRKGPLGPHSMA